MHLAVLHFVALDNGATATAQAIADELERRGLPGAATLILHRQRERAVGRLLPLMPRRQPIVGYVDNLLYSETKHVG